MVKYMESLDRLISLIRKKGDIAIAFSGGVDSSLVALAATRVEEVRATGIMIDNPTIPKNEAENGKKIAEELGLDLHVIDVDVMQDDEFLSNRPDRCGRCRRITLPDLIEYASSLGYEVVADGANLDDLDDYRPGMKAASELGIWHPLIEAEIDKREARSILKNSGISIHDRPSTPCLATRIPPDQSITPGKLRMIEDGEEALRAMDFRDIRFRLHERTDGEMLGIVEVDDPQRAMETWEAVLDSLPKMDIFLDPRGYRQGSLNRVQDP